MQFKFVAECECNSMSKYQHTIKIRNYAVPQEYYQVIKNYIKDAITNYAEELLPWDCRLRVRICKKTDDDFTQAYVAVKDRDYILIIHEDVAVELYQDNDNYFLGVIAHEIAHLHDFQRAIDSKYTNVKVNEYGSKTKKEYCIKEGFRFWAEVHAYYLTYQLFNRKDVDNLTKFQTIQQVKKNRKRIENVWKLKEEKFQEEMEKITQSVKDSAYTFSKYYASRILFGDKYQYSQRVRKTPEYQTLQKFIKKLQGRVNRINRNPFGRYFNSRFQKLGKLLFQFFFQSLGYNLEVIDGKCHLTFDLYENYENLKTLCHKCNVFRRDSF